MYMDRHKTLINVEAIPYRNFKEKLHLIDKYKSIKRYRVEDLGGLIYVTELSLDI